MVCWQNTLFFQGDQSVSIKASADQVDGNLLYPKSPDLSVHLIWKSNFTETSRIMLDQISGYRGLTKLAHIQLTITDGVVS